MLWLEMNLPDQIDLADLDQITSDWLNSRRRLVAPKTLGRRLTAMRCLGRAFKTPILEDYSAPQAPTPTPHPLPGRIADLRRMLDACNDEQQTALVTMCGLMGMRISEARDICPTSFDFANRRVRVWGKGSKERWVPISSFAWEIMLPIVVMAMHEPNAPIVKMGDRSAREAITRIGARAGVSRSVSSHDLRATFATEAYRKSGHDIRVVQDLLGHATSKQTELYIGLDDSTRSAATEIME